MRLYASFQPVLRREYKGKFQKFRLLSSPTTVQSWKLSELRITDGKRVTTAMEAGIVDHVCILEEIVILSYKYTY